jgi:hypothetical protein
MRLWRSGTLGGRRWLFCGCGCGCGQTRVPESGADTITAIDASLPCRGLPGHRLPLPFSAVLCDKQLLLSTSERH